MKKNFVVFSFLIILFNFPVYSQGNMNIYTKNGLVQVKLSDIDSLTFISSNLPSVTCSTVANLLEERNNC